MQQSLQDFCKARVHTVDGLITKELHEHSHLQEERHVQIAKVLTVVKERAATANDMSTPANIISDATMGLPGAVRAHIVEKNVKRTIQRTRLRTAAAPANPQNCEDLEIPDSYKHILLDDARGLELFLQYDSGAEENRILIFGTEESKRVLEQKTQERKAKDARTNNEVEGHHNLINKMLSMQHPTIWKFIEALRKLQNINKNKIEALCAQGPPAKRRKYKDLDARLKTIVEDFANRDI